MAIVIITQNYPENLIASMDAVANECPRGLPGSQHIIGYSHRQSTDRDDPTPRIMCFQMDAPREIKEMHPWLSVAQNNLWDRYHDYCVARQKELSR